MAKEKFTAELVKFLQDNPKVTRVYMNDNGGWLARRHPAFRTEVNREYILKPEPNKPKQDNGTA